ncbi:MAG: crossover junction endodeoxyribonuclease RuvC [Candidatus Eremiobacteraeota bacterium]|nr:crossover junction endodeoxyribonuclease RuvC [Candidatus Eremiobacteraeota bacterium]
MKERILGVDPGLRVTGYGAVEIRDANVRLIEAGVVAPRPALTLEQRLEQLHRGIADVVAATRPNVIVIEELYTTYKNPLTAIMMGHARGVLCLAGAQHGVPVQTLGHSLVKRALVGSGTAKKDQVNLMVTHLLGLRRRPEPNDVSDALALALAYVNVRNHERTLPAALLRLTKDEPHARRRKLA